jgi:hypothetical protein
MGDGGERATLEEDLDADDGGAAFLHALERQLLSQMDSAQHALETAHESFGDDWQAEQRIQQLVRDELAPTFFEKPAGLVRPVRVSESAVKKVAAVATGALTKVGNVPVGGLILSAIKIVKTGTITGYLKLLLEDGSLHAQAADDAAYIKAKKERKMVKAVASPVPVAGTASTAFHAAKGVNKWMNSTRGVHRKEVAGRILKGIKQDPPDRSYLSIAHALYINKDNPGLWICYLRACADEELAINVLKAKLASS